MHAKLKEFDFALSVFKKILKIDKKNFEAMMNIGLIRLQIDQKEKGYRNLEQSLQFGPPKYKLVLLQNFHNSYEYKQADIKIRLAEYYFKDEQKIENAQRMLMQAIEANVNRGDAHILLAKIYEKKNMYDEALI